MTKMIVFYLALGLMAGMGGANNYNFRPSSFATGQRASIAGANRNYNTRLMYTYNTGVTESGWAFTGSLTYRWGNGLGFVEGTSYNSLSYFFGAEKLINEKHSLSLVTWGNPTERGTQAASTDEMYWIANNYLYNSAWGYQDGKKRNSRIVKDFAPAAMLTWDWKLNESDKLTTSLLGKYAMYSSSRLNYNNSSNPAPDYYSTMPSYYFDVWAPFDGDRNETALANWQAAYDYLSASKENRQVQWDKMYFANRMASLQGSDAMYYLQRYHDDQLSLSLSSYLYKKLSDISTFRNINTYVVKNYGEDGIEARYDLNSDPNKQIGKDDRFGYDYNIFVNKAQAWAGLSSDIEVVHFFLNGRVAGTTMQREGLMRNGLAPDNSYGKSGTAKFLDGGGKTGASVNLGHGSAMLFGLGYEVKTPAARTAFQAAQINNDFVRDLKNEKVFSAELGYQLQTSWLNASLNAYYSHLYDVTEQSMYYMDDRRSFTYVSLSNIEKEYYGLELGMNIKVTEWLNLKALGTISDALYVNNADVAYMLSEDGRTYNDKVHNQGMREGCTPLTAASLDFNMHLGRWYVDVIGNYYDRIYLYYTPVTRYENRLPYNNDGTAKDYSTLPDQAKGHGGFMVDASIGRQFYLKHGRRLGFNLMLTNILNNQKIVTGGREQSRTDLDENGESIRTYSFQNTPYKFYANGINGMLMINYYF